MEKNDIQIKKNAFEKVKRKVLCNDYKYGGLKMINVQKIQSAALLHWAERLLSEQESDWKTIAVQAYKSVGFPSIFLSSSKTLKGLNKISNPFWRRVLTTWLLLNDKANPSSFFAQPIFNNSALMYQNAPLFIEACVKQNIQFVKDLFYNGIFLKYDNFINKMGQYSRSSLDYILLHHVIKAAEKNSDLDKNIETVPEIRFKGKVLGKLKRKGFLKLIKGH